MAADIEGQLRELARLAPQCVAIEPARQGPGSIVRIHRRANATAVRQRLSRLASERQSVLLSREAVVV